MMVVLGDVCDRRGVWGHLGGRRHRSIVLLLIGIQMHMLRHHRDELVLHLGIALRNR